MKGLSCLYLLFITRNAMNVKSGMKWYKIFIILPKLSSTLHNIMTFIFLRKTYKLQEFKSCAVEYLVLNLYNQNVKASKIKKNVTLTFINI